MTSSTIGSAGSRHHDLQAVSSASSNEAADMITVDYSKLFGSHAEQKETLKHLDHGLQTHGFVYVLLYCRRFFALDSPTKNLIAHPPSNAVKDHRGYCEDGVGHVNQLVFDPEEADIMRAAMTERKETIEMGNPRDPPDSGPNLWPPESVLPGFRQCYEAWWDACVEVEKTLQRALCQILGIDAETLCRAQERNISHASWIHYPPMPLTSLHSGQARRLNAHTDYGSLTLLLQDTVGGLEVHDGRAFRPVTPKPGAIVVNVGDILERQSNGRWKSSLHQVVSPRKKAVPEDPNTDGIAMDRYVVAYFGLPDPEVLVETLPGCETPGQWKPNIENWDEGKPLTSRDWMQKRVVAEYSEYSM